MNRKTKFFFFDFLKKIFWSIKKNFFCNSRQFFDIFNIKKLTYFNCTNSSIAASYSWGSVWKFIKINWKFQLFSLSLIFLVFTSFMCNLHSQYGILSYDIVEVRNCGAIINIFGSASIFNEFLCKLLIFLIFRGFWWFGRLKQRRKWKTKPESVTNRRKYRWKRRGESRFCWCWGGVMQARPNENVVKFFEF